jgi:hypothetical protein|tara:strand:+ start:1024 stop:1269 length:246 start_codon:yes stop_codon:yes gene_type:complete
MAKKKNDDVTVVSIGVGTMPAKKLKEMKKKAEMAYGGMANGKKHMYSAGGDVTDKLPNKGLRKLASTDKGRKAVRSMGFDV